MLPLAADEDLHGAITRGLLGRMPDLDLVRVQDIGLDETPDAVILEWAAKEGRILITQDENTLIGSAWKRVRDGLPMPGVLVPRKGSSIGKVIEDLLLIAQCGEAEDFKDQVKFVPL